MTIISTIRFEFEGDNGTTYETHREEDDPMRLVGGELVNADQLEVGDEIETHLGTARVLSRDPE